MKNFWKKLLNPILALAPMAGVTDSAFRQICKENGADVVYSEMASATAIFYNPKKTLELLEFNKSERPYVVQLFGKVPEHFGVAAKIITQKIKPDGIDINFGCPAKKVFGHGSGCALMPQKKLAREIISAVCKNTQLPVSIKIRAGIGDTSALQFIKNIKDLPFAAVMVHGRTYEGKFTEKIDFKIISEIKKIIPDKIVLANGSITTPEQALEVLKNYPELDGIGIARGALGKPFIFQEIKSLLNYHSERSEESLPAGRRVIRSLDKLGMTNKYDFKFIKRLAIRHTQLLYKSKGKKGMFETRKHLAWYVKGFPGAAELRKKLVLVKSVKEIKEILAKK